MEAGAHYLQSYIPPTCCMELEKFQIAVNVSINDLSKLFLSLLDGRVAHRLRTSSRSAVPLTAGNKSKNPVADRQQLVLLLNDTSPADASCSQQDKQANLRSWLGHN